MAAPASQMWGWLLPARLGRRCSITRSNTCWSRKKKVKANLSASPHSGSLPVVRLLFPEPVAVSPPLNWSPGCHVYGLLGVQHQQQAFLELVHALEQFARRRLDV